MLVCTAVLLLAVSGLLVEPMHRTQVQYDLTNAPVKGVGPGVVLATTALGAFRGIIVDIVWIRMEALKQDDKFFEIVQLADLACRLSPQFSKVWDFNAWNMAYNVSVEIPQLDERWSWVKKGIELLRDQGIPNNPTEPELYFSLAWTYMHKVGDQLDDAHFFYKQELGLEMHEVLGGGGSKEDLQRLAKAPRTRRELLLDPGVKELHAKLVAAGWDPLDETSDEGIATFFLWLRRPDGLPGAARRLMEDKANRAAVQKIADHARIRRLEKMHMSPEKMVAVMDEFGPFDWRGPHSHAVYWATEGMKAAHSYKARVQRRRKAHGIEKKPEEDEFDEGTVGMAYGDINYDRVIYGALQNLVSRGRLLYGSRGQILPMVGPDYRFTEALVKHFQRVITKHQETDRYMTGLNSAYENFLKRMATEYYYTGSETKSLYYYKLLQKEYPKTAYDMSYDAFMRGHMQEYIGMMGPSECRRVVRGLLAQSYFYLGAGADDRASGLYNQARAVTQFWNKQRGEGMTQRVDFEKSKEVVLIDIFAGRVGFPLEVLERLAGRLPADAVAKIKQAVQKLREGGPIRPMEVPDDDRRVPDR